MKPELDSTSTPILEREPSHDDEHQSEVLDDAVEDDSAEPLPPLERPADEVLELSPEWQDWVIENALEGATVYDMVQTIVDAGAPREQIEQDVIRLCTSAGFRAAQQWRRKALRLTKANNLRIAYHRGHGPHEIERVAGLDGETLRARYLRFCQPVILTDIANTWPALTKWTDEYLGECLGDVETQVCLGRESKDDPDRDIERFFHTLPFRDVIAAIQAAHDTNDVYLIGNNKFFERPEAQILVDDIGSNLEQFLDDRGRKKERMSFWYGPKGTKTKLHHDPTSVLYSQLRGSKRFRLVAPSNTPALYAASNTYAKVDPVEAATTAGDRVYDVTLRAGELMLLPAGWWHEVTALESSVSLGFTNLRGPTSFAWYAPGKIGNEVVTLGTPPAPGEADAETAEDNDAAAQ